MKLNYMNQPPGEPPPKNEFTPNAIFVAALTPQ